MQTVSGKPRQATSVLPRSIGAAVASATQLKGSRRFTGGAGKAKMLSWMQSFERSIPFACWHGGALRCIYTNMFSSRKYQSLKRMIPRTVRKWGIQKVKERRGSGNSPPTFFRGSWWPIFLYLTTHVNGFRCNKCWSSYRWLFLLSPVVQSDGCSLWFTCKEVFSSYGLWSMIFSSTWRSTSIRIKFNFWQSRPFRTSISWLVESRLENPFWHW